MVVFTLIIAFIFFLMIGVPIAFVLGLTPLVAMMIQGETPLILAAQRIFTGIDSPILMAVPFFILTGNILSGIFTPTESACIAVFYALFLSLVVYRDIDIRRLPRILIDTAATSSLVMMVVGMASIFSWLLASEEIPQMITEHIMSVTTNKVLILLLLNAVLLIIGTFMETTASLIILTPVLLPLMKQIGVDPLHFGVILVLNLVIGLTTPPVGGIMF